MNKKYESPEIELLWLALDILTTSDNDVLFGDENNDDEQNWGQYY
jgi:hypothetical protein